MLINKGFLKVEILTILYFAQCNNDTQKREDREKEKSEAKRSNIYHSILLTIIKAFL